jgi:3-hydroxyisobutyrate dehydrogenase-like beta-hydroxyacid dehydrogenase
LYKIKWLKVVIMKVGFIGFGEVASTLSQGLMENGADVYTCILDRGTRTKEMAKKTKVKLYNSYRMLAERSDILISSVVPSNAIDVAEMVGKYSKGIYVDMNNVSPKTVRKTLGMIENGKTVDAAIIGSVLKNGINVKVIASGAFAGAFAELEDYGMNITVVGDENGQASGIKLLRSAYTKGVSALLFESIYYAYKMGIDKEVLNYISETEGQDFTDSSVSRIISAAFHAERRSEEMMEVVEMLSEKQNPVMSKATAEFFRNLSKNIKRHENRPENYIEVFNLLSED